MPMHKSECVSVVETLSIGQRDTLISHIVNTISMIARIEINASIAVKCNAHLRMIWEPGYVTVNFPGYVLLILAGLRALVPTGRWKIS